MSLQMFSSLCSILHYEIDELTCVSYASRDAINRQQDGICQFILFAICVAAFLARIVVRNTARCTQTAQQRNLEVAQRIDIRVAAADRLLQDGGRVEECFTTDDAN